MPTLKQLRCLVAIASTRHFRRAAQLCHVTQPTLSAQLAALEERLGVVLVERGRHGASLTPVGRQIVERAMFALRCAGEIQEIANAGRHGVAGTVRIGVLPTLGPYMLAELMSDIRKRHPKLKLYVREELSSDLLANLANGRHDAVLTSLPIRSPGIEVQPLFWEPIILAIPKDHRLAAHRPLSRADLKHQALLTLEPGHAINRQVRELCEKYQMEAQLDYEGTSLDTLRVMVGLGMGLALLPALYVRSELPRVSDVVLAQFPGARPGRTIALAWRKSAPRAADHAGLARSLREVVSKRLGATVRVIA